MGREQLRQVDRKTGKCAKYEETEDRQHDRVVRLEAAKSQVQRQAYLH